MIQKPSHARPIIIKSAGILILVSLIWLFSKNIFDADAKDVSQYQDLAPVSGSGSGSGALIEEVPSTTVRSELPDYVIDRFGTPPSIPDGPASEELVQAVETIFGSDLHAFIWGAEQTKALVTINQSGDPRLAWLISDFMRIAGSKELISILSDSAGELLNITIDRGNLWGDTIDHLIAWNIPAPANYLRYKKIFIR